MIPPVVGGPHPGSHNDEAKRPDRRHDQAQRLRGHGVTVNDEEVGVDGDGGSKDGTGDIPLRPQPALRPAGLGPNMDSVVVNPDKVGDERGGLNNVGDEKHIDEHQQWVVALVAPSNVGHRADRDLVGGVGMIAAGEVVARAPVAAGRQGRQRGLCRAGEGVGRGLSA